LKSDSEDKELETGTGEFVNADDAAEAEEQLPDEIGDVKVADEVISIVAGLAAQEVNGVIGMSGSFAEGLNEFLGKKSFAKGVRITVDGHVVTAAVYVNVEYGSCIPEIALEIQEKVKEAIENMTGIHFSRFAAAGSGIAADAGIGFNYHATSCLCGNRIYLPYFAFNYTITTT
jgi:uncharacterized alkaline shock family protein YloU